MSLPIFSKQNKFLKLSRLQKQTLESLHFQPYYKNAVYVRRYNMCVRAVRSVFLFLHLRWQIRNKVIHLRVKMSYYLQGKIVLSPEVQFRSAEGKEHFPLLQGCCGYHELTTFLSCCLLMLCCYSQIIQCLDLTVVASSLPQTSIAHRLPAATCLTCRCPECWLCFAKLLLCVIATKER